MPKEQINLLLYMLDDIRKDTLKGVSGLTKEQLFQPPVEGEFPIGAYLMHLGEVDLFWLSVITGEQQPEELKKRVYSDCWFDCKKENYNPPKSPLEAKEYIDAITQARERVRKYIMCLNDDNLEESITNKFPWAKEERTYSKKWILHHLIEHEAHTRGQMFMLIRMAGFKKKGEND